MDSDGEFFDKLALSCHKSLNDSELTANCSMSSIAPNTLNNDINNDNFFGYVVSVQEDSSLIAICFVIVVDILLT